MALKVVRYLGNSHTIQRQANNGGFAEVYIGPPAAETRSIKFFFFFSFFVFVFLSSIYIFLYFSIHKYGFAKQDILN